MAQRICVFQDYLSELSLSEKRQMINESGAELLEAASDSSDVHGFPNAETNERSQRRGSFSRRDYRSLIEDLRRLYGINAASGLSALIGGGADTMPYLNLSGASREAISFIQSRREYSDRNHLAWAINPDNWFLVESEASSITLQSKMWQAFPSLVFDNGPMECASNSDGTLALEHVEDILQSTGIIELWKSGNLGQDAECVVFDTGVSQQLEASGVKASSVGGLSRIDADGHGSAVVGLIRALSPRAAIESVCVTRSYSNGQIWNLFSGLTQLCQRHGIIVNLSLGASPDWIRSLGPQAMGFRETISNTLAGLASQSIFPIGAAGNDGIPSLRWPAAAPDCLAVGSHNSSFRRSTFSNFGDKLPNLILAPGGEIRQMDSRVDGFGRYGFGLTRDLYGTSFSTAVTSATACLLMRYGWFTKMGIRSRISLFKNHCHVNDQGFPILNVVDIGAVWPF